MDEQQSTKRERRVKKREEQKKETRRGNQMRQMREYGVVAAVLILVVAGGYFWLRPSASDVPVIAVEGESVPSMDGGHIRPGIGHAAYNSNPPTSGPHDATPARCKTYDAADDAPTDEAIVHSLEHGAVWISYQPDAPEEVIAAIEDLGKSGKVLVSPRAENDSLVAVAAWTKIFKITEWTPESEGEIKGFIQANRNRGPELVAC